MGIPGEQLNEWSCCFSPIEKPPSNRSYLMGPSASFLLPNHRRICKILLSRYRYRNNGSTFAAYAIAHPPPKKVNLMRETDVTAPVNFFWTLFWDGSFVLIGL